MADRLQAIGVDLDLSDKGLGLRSRRYTMLIDDGVVMLRFCPAYVNADPAVGCNDMQ